MNDRELLEAAAKAAGIEVLQDPNGVWRNVTGFHPSMNIFAGSAWNPITDDGDALRLAVALRAKHVRINLGVGGVCVDMRTVQADEFCPPDAMNFDPYAATRRAIVRAAAQIGKGMINDSTAVHP